MPSEQDKIAAKNAKFEVLILVLMENTLREN